MGDHQRSPTTTDFYSILGLTKNAAIKDIRKSYKSLVMKWHPDKNPSNKNEAEAKFYAINEAYCEVINGKNQCQRITGSDERPTARPAERTHNHHQSVDDSFFSRPSFLSRNFSRRSKTPNPRSTTQTPTDSRATLSRNMSRRSSAETETTSPVSSTSRRSLYRNMSRSSATVETEIASPESRGSSRSTTPTTNFLRKSAASESEIASLGSRGSLSRNMSSRKSVTEASEIASPESRGSSRSTTPTSFRRSSTEAELPGLVSRSASRRSTTPIIFSQSTARRKPPPIEKKLECSLEELSKGCVKQIKIRRDVLTDTGMVDKEEELLKIRVKPGWKKGTKITFEGKGDEKPGHLPADIIFVIDERRHPLFQRDGDDLEIGFEIPLLKALTGCSISVPLLGGEKMTLSFDDVIYPGFEKVIAGQGMPISREDGRRGDLRIKFLVSFPADLSDEQRSLAVSILNDCFDP